VEKIEIGFDKGRVLTVSQKSAAGNNFCIISILSADSWFNQAFEDRNEPRPESLRATNFEGKKYEDFNRYGRL
jgi:hypothetical protein